METPQSEKEINLLLEKALKKVKDTHTVRVGLLVAGIILASFTIARVFISNNNFATSADPDMFQNHK